MELKQSVGIDDVKDFWKLLRCAAAEFVGTMMLCLVGCGAALNWKTGFDVTQISLAFGLVVMAMVTVTGNVSGGHLNPAVSVGLMVGGHLSFLKAAVYIFVQVMGAIVGVGVLKLVTPHDQQDSFGANALHSMDGSNGVDIPVAGAVLLEALLTMMLVLVVYASAVDANTKAVNGVAPILIGLTVAAANLFCISYTGTSINPARSVGSAVFAEDGTSRSQLWIFWVGPILGGAAGGLLYTFVLQDTCKKSLEVGLRMSEDINRNAAK